MRRHGQAGFTLIEMLLTLSIMVILAGLTLPLYRSYQTRTDLDVTTESIANMFRRAQVYARGVQQDSAWSVHIDNGTATLYRGTIYATRSTGFDETMTIPTTFVLNWTGDVSFAKLSGAPSITGSMTITNTTNETRTVTVNAKGTIFY